MPEFGISEFSILAAGGTEKRKKTKLRNIANRGEYQHYKDYYLALRAAIKSVVKGNKPESYLEIVVKRQADMSKQSKYRTVISNYRNWREGKYVEGFPEVSNKYIFMNTIITCNPEFNLLIDGQRKLVKLNFSISDPMTQDRANIICALMREVIGDNSFEYLVLDLANQKEYFFKGDHYQVMDVIHSKIMEVEGWWDNFFSENEM